MQKQIFSGFFDSVQRVSPVVSNRYLLSLVVWVLLLLSCASSDLNKPEMYLSYVQNEENGLLQNIVNGDLSYSLRLIPSQYFLLKDHEIELLDKSEKDALISDYQHSLYFILDLSPRNDSDNIIDRNTYNIEEFKRKTLGLNFNLEQLVALEINNELIYPVLSSMQNVYELEGSKSVLLAFQIEEEIKTDLKVLFQDEIFTGETFDFDFKKSAIDRIPQLNI